MSELLTLVAMLLFYPFVVLMVAISGPHFDGEGRANTRTKGQDSE